MTNCPNCGAPYTLHSRICEYCGTVREKLPDEIRMEQELEQARMDVEQAKREFLTLRLQDAQQAAVNANFTRAAYKQDVHARESLQAQIARNAAARRVEDCARTAFIACVVTALTVVARAALMLIW